MNARFYDPATGRFISQDSYTGNPYDPWTQHLYTYCGNNPTNMVDPTGHKAKWTVYADAANACYSYYLDYLKLANDLSMSIIDAKRAGKSSNQQISGDEKRLE